jgi:hypothetical protein
MKDKKWYFADVYGDKKIKKIILRREQWN